MFVFFVSSFIISCQIPLKTRSLRHSMLCIASATLGAAARACDIYAGAGTPCVAAHSTVRALYSDFRGPLYQLKRAVDNVTKDISVNAVGYADAAAQELFCAGTRCDMQRIYDQSPMANHLDPAPASKASWPPAVPRG